jgi:hypothetical protein
MPGVICGPEMAFRLGDWKGRAVLAAVIAAGFLLTGAGTALHERLRTRGELRVQARTFAQSSTGPIANAYQDFFKAGFYKFREEVLERMNLNTSLQRIRIVDLSGQVRFDSDDMTAAAAPLPNAPVLSPATLAAVVGQDRAMFVGGNRAEAMRFDVVDPHLEDWGRHEVSVVYSFDIEPVMLELKARQLMTLAPLVIAGAAVTIALALALIRRIA